MKKLIAKFLSGERLLKKEEDKLWKYLRDKADKVFSVWIRNRDKGRDCITCEVPTCKHKIEHNCHWIERGWYSHRRNPDNCYGGCSSCNTFHEGEHKIYFTSIMIKKFGQERVDEQLRTRNKIKPRIDELLDIIEKYKNVN